MEKDHWIFLSPHFDDVVLSCGGLVWTLTQEGRRVEIWTIMGGFPPDEAYSDFARENHERWGMSGVEAIRMRRGEDHAACELLGAQPRYFDWLDVIYRRDPDMDESIVHNNVELFGKSPEPSLIAQIAQLLRFEVPADAALISPMGLGNHVDHQAVFLAAEASGRIDAYYADYPYILKQFDDPRFLNDSWARSTKHLSQDALSAWQDAVLSHRSQLSGLWINDQEARLALRNYMAGGGGRLWKKPAS